jgi:hypothetical protein
MKIKSMLFIMLFGMFSMTVFGTTTELKQKSKTEFTKAVSQVSTVNVATEMNVVFASVNATNFQGVHETQKIVNENEPITISTNTDVGWQRNMIVFYNYFYKEKLNSNRNLKAVDIGY